jgi:serine/threonine protein kinase
MAVVNAEKFLELVKKSQLAEADQLETALARIRIQHSGQLPGDALKLAECLQQEKIITGWHAEKLLQGKYKGFFLGKYKLLGHIGSGGMSSVYLAEHTMMRDYRAIKVLPPSKMVKSSYLARFQQEAKAIASLNHPNIVRAYDIDNQGDTHYIVMEYVAGDDLQTLVKKKGPLPVAVVANYIMQAAHGLQHAHDCGLIHRDVKPANFLLGKNGVVKLLDLGLALFTDEGKASLTIDHNDKVLGTADYLAPEQALNSHGVDQRADLYGLGCTMYYLLTGQPPFPDGSIAQRIAKHQKIMPTEIRKLRPDCPGELEGICWKLIQKDPNYRYSSAQQAAEVLQSWMVKAQVPSAVGSGSSFSLGEECDQRFGTPSGKSGTALSDTLSNREGDTLSDRPASSVIKRLSASDSGILVRLANNSSAGSQIDLQSTVKKSQKNSGSPSKISQATPAKRPQGSSPTNRPASNSSRTISEIAQENAANAQKRIQHEGSAHHHSLVITQSQKIYWFAGALLLFVLAVLLGIAIARLTDSWKSSPDTPADQQEAFQ